jgi:hypothetical protein
MVFLPGCSGAVGVTLYDQGVAVLHDPLYGFALFQFQSLGQRGGADEVELAGLVGAFDELDLREVAHKSMMTLAISLVKRRN